MSPLKGLFQRDAKEKKLEENKSPLLIQKLQEAGYSNEEIERLLKDIPTSFPVSLLKDIVFLPKDELLEKHTSDDYKAYSRSYLLDDILKRGGRSGGSSSSSPIGGR